MQNLLNGICVKGIIKPGEIYVFTQSEDRLDEMEGPDISYTIQSDEELMAALEMEVFRVLPSWYNLKGFLGWEKLSDNCYQFRLSCHPSEYSKRTVYSLYLHRMIHVSERLEWVKRYFTEGECGERHESGYD